MRLPASLISIPVFLSAAHFILQAPGAQAAAPLEDAAQLLARSLAIDVRCHYLSPDDSQSLKDIVARAEITLAEKKSVSAAKAILAKGRASGKVTACDANAEQLVRQMLAAARNATALPTPPETSAKPMKPVAVVQPKPVVPAPKPVLIAPPVVEAATSEMPKTVVQPIKRVAVKPKPVIAAKPRAETPLPKHVRSKSLDTYAVLAEDYFVELRCRDMPASAVRRMYATVIATHRRVLADNSRSAVRTMLRSAENRARGRSCN